MAITKTTFMELNKQAFEDPNWHTALNDTLDRLDKIAEAAAGEPDTVIAGLWLGRMYLDTDTGIYWMCTGGSDLEDPANTTWTKAGEKLILGSVTETHQWEKTQFYQWKSIQSGVPAGEAAGTLRLELNDGPYYELVLAEEVTTLIIERGGAALAADDFATDVKIRVVKGGFDYGVAWATAVAKWSYDIEPIIPLNTSVYVVLTKTLAGTIEGSFLGGF